MSRKIAFAVPAATSVAACGGALFFWYPWSSIVRSCVDTYLLHTRPSVLLVPEQATSWRDYFSGLDISSFSALILALLCTRLAYVGARSALRYSWRDGRGYFDRVDHRVLFSVRFESLCIRLGLLGRARSFRLAAVAQMSTFSPRAVISTAPTLTDQIARVADAPGQRACRGRRAWWGNAGRALHDSARGGHLPALVRPSGVDLCGDRCRVRCHSRATLAQRSAQESGPDSHDVPRIGHVRRGGVSRAQTRRVNRPRIAREDASTHARHLASGPGNPHQCVRTGAAEPTCRVR